MGLFQSFPSRTRLGKISALVGIGINLLLFVGKLIVGMMFGALSVTADAMNNLSDASGSIVALLGFTLSEKPADEDHPYGHARLEYISGMIVAAMILFVGYELGKSAIEKILSPAPIVFSAITVVVLVASILIKLGLAVFYHKAGKAIHSAALQATAIDSRNDVLTTTAVLVAIVVESVTDWQIDGYISLAVALFIIYSGVQLIKDTVDPLIGKAGSTELRAAIAEVVQRDPRVRGYHDLLIHDYGPDHCFASVHVEIDHREDTLLCHTIIDDMEQECLNALHVHLVVHYDPVITDDDTLDHLQHRVQEILYSFDKTLCLHDFRMAYTEGGAKLIFDVSLPDRLQCKKKDIRDYVNSALAELDGNTYTASITFDPGATDL